MQFVYFYATNTNFIKIFFLLKLVIFFDHQQSQQHQMEAFSIFRDCSHTKIKDPYHSLKYTLALCTAELYFGYTLIYISAVDFRVIAKNYSIDFDIDLAQGMFQGILPIGGAVGAVSSTYFISKFSRRQVLFIFSLIGSILCLLSLYPNYKIFLVIRLLQGFCSGLFSSVVPLIVRENSPIEMGSITGTMPNLVIIFGLFFVYFFGFVLGSISGDMTGESTWQIIFLFPLLVLAAHTYLMWKVFPYQTPKYLAQNGRVQQLKHLLKQFYREEYVQQLCNQNLKAYGSTSDDNGTANKEVYNSKSALTFGIFFAILCPFVGINVMMSYCGDIASQVLPSLKSIIGALLMLAFWVFSAISIAYVGKYGRKEMTIWGTYGIAATLYAITFGYFMVGTSLTTAQMIIFLSMIAYLFVYGMTYAPIMWMWVAEALQPAVIGYAIMLNWAGAALIMIFFPLVQAAVPNPGYIFAFFGTFAVLSIPITKKIMLQTKDKSDIQIQQQYRALDRQIWGTAETKQTEMSLLNKQMMR